MSRAPANASMKSVPANAPLKSRSANALVKSALALGTRPARIALAPALAGVLLAALALGAAGCGSPATSVTGVWEGRMIIEDDDAVYEVTLDLETENGSLSGDGRISDDSGYEAPIDVTGGEVDGSEVSVSLEDAFGGAGFQGRLSGEVSGEEFSGTGKWYGTSATNAAGDAFAFELEKSGEG